MGFLSCHIIRLFQMVNHISSTALTHGSIVLTIHDDLMSFISVIFTFTISSFSSASRIVQKERQPHSRSFVHLLTNKLNNELQLNALIIWTASAVCELRERERTNKILFNWLYQQFINQYCFYWLHPLLGFLYIISKRILFKNSHRIT